MRSSILVLFIILLVGCKTKTIYVPTETIKTEYKNNYVRDSIYLMDSVFVDRYTKNDTVFINKEKYRYLYKDKLVRDTITLYEVKEIPFPIVETKEVNKLKKWQVILMVLGGVFIGCIGFKVYRFVK